MLLLLIHSHQDLALTSPTRARVYDPLYRALPGLLNQAILARNKDIHLLRMTNGDVEKVRKIIRGQRTKLGGQ